MDECDSGDDSCRYCGSWVFGRVERLEPGGENPNQEIQFQGDNCRLGKMFAVVVKKRDARTLIPIIRRFVRPGSVIMSDMWKAYDRISEINANGMYYYEHYKVNHSENFKDPVTGAHTNLCEGAWSSQYKRHIPNQAYNEKALQGHLFERMWRRKYKDDLWKNFWRALSETRFEYTGSHSKVALK